MPSSFYRLLPDDERYPDRCFFGAPIGDDGDEIDPRCFTSATHYTGKRPVEIEVRYPGRMVAFNFAAFDAPLVSEPLGRLLESACSEEIQLLPVRVKGMEGSMFLLNVLSRCECLDERRSEILKWSAEDGRPDKTGQYRMVVHLRIDSEKAGHHSIFRISGWEIALVVSDWLWQQMAHIPSLGIRADAVS